ncbi:MAG: sulfatase-like hydrolase/transferase [Gammaproteobacteria bacterium]|nr:sulfatase-like hydrolase/transferase [Gammaproteobacteria bacterium]
MMLSTPLTVDKPNVILVMSDDQGWTQTGYYGHPLVKTPNLDDMAAKGLRMDRFYATAPMCSPTRAAVLTGRSNDRTGVFKVGDPINTQEKMLSTAFREAGTIDPRVSQYPSATTDIFPTLIDVAGLDPNSINPVNDGISLARVLANNEPARREEPMGFRVVAGRAWLDNDWKLVRNYTSGEDGEFELYNLAGDPSESRSLIRQRSYIAARMMEELSVWDASVERSIAGADYPSAEALPK